MENQGNAKHKKNTSEEVEVGTTVEASSQVRNNLPNHATQMNKKLQILFNNHSLLKKSLHSLAQLDSLHSNHKQAMQKLKDIGVPQSPHCHINNRDKHMNVQRMWQSNYLEW